MVEGGSGHFGFLARHQNSVPSTQMQRRKAILRATAMRAFFGPMRCTRHMPQALSGENQGGMVIQVRDVEPWNPWAGGRACPRDEALPV